MFFCDNYYIPYNLAMTLKQFPNSEAKLIGTVKFTNVDSTNHYYLSQAVAKLKDAEHGV